MFQIKKADLKDIYIIQDIATQTWPATYRSILSADQIRYMMELMYSYETIKDQMDRKIDFFLIIYHDKPIGFAGIELNFKPKITKLHKLYLLPINHGLGLGRSFLKYLATYAQEMDQTDLILNVNRENVAKDFYFSQGFVIDQEVDVSIGNGYFMNDYIMRLKL